MKKDIWITLIFCLLLIGIVISANLDLDWLNFTNRIQGADKIAHFGLFGLLAFLVNNMLNGKQVQLLGNSILLGSFCVLIVVLMEEFSQIFIPSRTFDITDIMYDGVGIYLGGFCANLINRGEIGLQVPFLTRFDQI